MRASPPFRKMSNVNSTTRSSTPPPGASRRTFGTNPLYRAAGPSSRKIVPRLQGKGGNSSSVIRSIETRNDSRWIRPIVFRQRARTWLASTLNARLDDLIQDEMKSLAMSHHKPGSTTHVKSGVRARAQIRRRSAWVEFIQNEIAYGVFKTVPTKPPTPPATKLLNSSEPRVCSGLF